MADKPVSLMRLTEIKDIAELPEGEFVCEPKYDGYLSQVIYKDDGVRLYSRRGQDYTVKFPDVVEHLDKQKLPPGTMLLAELCWIVDGKQDISNIQSIANSNVDKALEKYNSYKGFPVLYVFDILWYGDEPVYNKPFKERRKILEKKIKNSKYIKLSEVYPFEKWPEVMEKSIAANGEGVVFKNVDSKYVFKKLGESEPKPSGIWYKFKGGGGKSDTDDFVVYDWTTGEEGKLILAFGQFYRGQLYHVGKIDNFSRETERELWDKLKKGKIFTIEIGFQERTSTGKLRHQRFIRERPDKAPKDATLPNSEWAKYLKKVELKDDKILTKVSWYEYAIEKIAANDKWSTVIIDSKEFGKLTKEDIHSYYCDPKVKNELMKQFKKYDVLVYQTFSKGKSVLRRHPPNSKRPITITKADGDVSDPNDYYYWVENRTTEFHIVIGETTDIVWIDLDPHEKFTDWKKVKEYTRKCRDLLSRQNKIKKVEVRFSGNRGFHVIGHLKCREDTTKAREWLRGLLEHLAEGDDDVVVGLAKNNQMRLDVSTLRKKGSIRAAWSLHRKTGLVACPVKNIMDFDKHDAKIEKVLGYKPEPATHLKEEKKRTAGLYWYGLYKC